MANRVFIEPTEFKNTRTGDIDFGVRMWDNFESWYGDAFGSLPDDDLELLTAILRIGCDDQTYEHITDFIVESSPDIYFVGGRSYTKSEYASVVTSYLREENDSSAG